MEYLKIISSLGLGALGMYFMFELCKRMLNQVVGAITKVNDSMEMFIKEQHEEHKEIIATLREMRRDITHKINK
jgi:hypothetical protein